LELRKINIKIILKNFSLTAFPRTQAQRTDR
jgi:hypothetical protein